MFHNILVAVDGSTNSDLALTQAIDLAEAERSRLTLMTGIVPVPVGGLAASTTALPEAIRGVQAEAESVIRRARDRVPDDVPGDDDRHRRTNPPCPDRAGRGRAPRPHRDGLARPRSGRRWRCSAASATTSFTTARSRC